MRLQDRLKLAIQAFRAAPDLSMRLTSGVDARPQFYHHELDFYSKSAIVHACIKLRSDSIARPRLAVYRNAKGERSEVSDRPLAVMLRQVNPFWTRGQLWRATESDLLIWGNAYWAIERDASGVPREIWRMRPDWVEIVGDERNYISKYRYPTESSQPFDWGVDEVIHFRYINPTNEYYGLSPLSAARIATETGIDAGEFNRTFFENYAMPATALKSKEPLNKEQSDVLLENWNNALKGVTRQHKTVILPFGLEVDKLTITQKDAEWLNGMKWSLEDIARVFRVPTPLIGEEKAVYKNIREAELAFWHECMIPELLWIEEILNEELVPMFNEDLYVAFDLSNVEALQEDAAVQAERLTKLIDRGIITINEARRQMNLVKVSWGDTWYAPLNLSPVSSTSKPATPGDAKASKLETTLSQISDNLRHYRLSRSDVEELGDVFASFFEDESKLIASAFSRSIRQAAYDWQRWHRLLAPKVVDKLVRFVVDGVEASNKQLGLEAGFNVENVRASDWAEKHAAELLDVSKKKATLSVTEETRKVVNKIVTQAQKEGWSVNQLRQAIINDAMFSRQRAQLIARTESQRAYNVGNFEGYKESGVVKQKRWLLMGEACPVCVANAAQGAIRLNVEFQSGHQCPPAHPNCLCALEPVVD